MASVFADELFKTDVVASYYADKFHGRQTSSGEIFNMYAFTAAHKTLPFNTMVRVTNLENGQSVVVRVNDRGPFVKGREIDLSKAAAVQLGMIKSGTARVSLSIVDGGSAGNTSTEIASNAQKETAPVKVNVSASSSATSGSPAQVASSKWQKYAQPSPHQMWDIQLGAFSKKANAENMAHRLQSAGFDNVAYQNAGNVTRVVLRNIATDSVESYLQKLETKGFSDYFVRERKNIVAK